MSKVPVKKLLEKAAQGGPAPSAASGSSQRGAFSGGGFTLGSDEEQSSFIPDPNAPAATAPEEEHAIRHLTFWRDGFSIDDGPLLRYDVPENEATLKAINQGQAPPQVLNVRYGQPVELRVARRMTEDYRPPSPKPLGAFEGAGYRLGAPVPEIIGAGGSSSGGLAMAMPGAFDAPSTSSGSGSSRTSPPAPRHVDPASIRSRFAVDETQPATNLQVRLADGSRMRCRVNLTHTIGDIRNLINASSPEFLTRPYTIGTANPAYRELADNSVTVEGAGLSNSVIVQKWQ